jgi:hypothetical protein
MGLKKPIGSSSKESRDKTKRAGRGGKEMRVRGEIPRKDGTDDRVPLSAGLPMGLGSPWPCSGNKQFVKKCLQPKQCAVRVVVSERLAKKQKKQKGEKMGQKKKLLVAKLMCRCLDRNTRQHPAVPTKTNDRLFLGSNYSCTTLYVTATYGFYYCKLIYYFQVVD